MLTFNRKSKFLLLVASFVYFLNLALFFKIPLILQIFGIVALCFIPGYLLCLLFQIRVDDAFENFLYSIGMSIIFDLIFGLIINTILPVLGDNAPLSPLTLQIGYSIIILLLVSLIVVIEHVPEITIQPWKLHRIEKMLLIFGLVLLISFITGIYFINEGVTNLILIFSVVLVPVLLALCIIFYDDNLKRIFPFILFLISISLILMMALRSNYIIGTDITEEYYFFYTTLIHSIWVPDPSYLLSASLSISILPTVFENFLQIDQQLLFKLLYPLLFSITPLVIYVSIKKYVNELLALIASCYFIFQAIFILTSSNSRTSMGIFFLAFIVLILCNEELQNWKKYLLFMLFVTGTVFSHYSTTFIFLGIILLVYLLHLAFQKRERSGHPFLNLSLILFFTGLIFFWYQQVINTVFTSGFSVVLHRFTIFFDFLNQDAGKYVTPPAYNPSFLWYFSKFTQVFILVLIGIGILGVFCHFYQKRIQKIFFPNVNINVNKYLFFMGIVSIVLIFLIIFAPFLFFDYDLVRTKELLDLVLPVFLVFGMCIFIDIIVGLPRLSRLNLQSPKRIQAQISYSKSHKNQIISGILLFLLIPGLLLGTFIVYQIDGIPLSIILNPPKSSTELDFGYAYIFDQEADALAWLKNNSYKDSQILSDGYGNKKITSLLMKNWTLYQVSLVELPEQSILEKYVFLGVASEYYDVFKEPDGKKTNLTQLSYILSKKDKIFSNGAVFYK